MVCRWIETTWGDATQHQASTAAQNVMKRASRICSACLEVIAADSRTQWAVGSNASAAQISRFVTTCNEIADSLEQYDTSKHVDRDEDGMLGVFIGGEQPCIADFMVWPFFSRALLCLKEFNSDDAIMSSAAYSAQKGVLFQVWVESMRQCHAVQVTAANDRALVDAWKRTGRLDWFDYESVPVGQLHPHLVV